MRHWYWGISLCAPPMWFTSLVEVLASLIGHFSNFLTMECLPKFQELLRHNLKIYYGIADWVVQGTQKLRVVGYSFTWPSTTYDMAWIVCILIVSFLFCRLDSSGTQSVPSSGDGVHGHPGYPTYIHPQATSPNNNNCECVSSGYLMVHSVFISIMRFHACWRYSDKVLTVTFTNSLVRTVSNPPAPLCWNKSGTYWTV